MYELKNYMEILVGQMFDTATRDMEICRCKKCRLDIMAIALNKLQPRYIVSEDTQLYIKLNVFRQQFNTDIISAITKGTMIVSGNVRHD